MLWCLGQLAATALLCQGGIPNPPWPYTPGTYRGHPKGIVVSDNDNGGEVLTPQPCQPSLWKNRDGLMDPRCPRQPDCGSQGSLWCAVSTCSFMVPSSLPQGRHRAMMMAGRPLTDNKATNCLAQDRGAQ